MDKNAYSEKGGIDMLTRNDSYIGAKNQEGM